MIQHDVGLSPGSIRPRDDDWIRPIVEFWNMLSVQEQSGATTWDDLEILGRRVTQALSSSPPDKHEAESATAEAFARLSGTFDF